MNVRVWTAALISVANVGVMNATRQAHGEMPARHVVEFPETVAFGAGGLLENFDNRIARLETFLGSLEGRLSPYFEELRVLIEGAQS